jgi:hypothetical protein
MKGRTSFPMMMTASCFWPPPVRWLSGLKTDRDLLIYILWQLGVATNQENGEIFCLTYSKERRRKPT